MNKNEYLKYLRDVQNNYKNECIEIKNLFNEDLKNELLGIRKYNIDKSKLLILLESIILPFLSNEKTAYIAPFIMILIIKNIMNIVINDIEINNINKNYEIIENYLYTFESQRDKIENTIEFFNRTSQDEINKYLSYKIN